MSTDHPEVFEIGTLRFDARDQTLWCNGKQAKLSAREYELLVVLARSAGHIVSYRRLNLRIWGEAQASPSCGLRLTILRLRRKLGAECIDEVQITNFVGMGYRLDVSQTHVTSSAENSRPN